MLSIVGMLDGFACPAAGMPGAAGLVRSVAGMPGAAGSVSSVAGMPGAAGSVSLVAGMPGAAGSVSSIERCKIFESKVLPYCFEKIFDRGRSALILIPQIRDLGSCFVEFLQSSFRCFLIDGAFLLTIMFQVVLLTEYHASNRTERLH